MNTTATLAAALLAACLSTAAQADAMSDFATIFNTCKATYQNIRAGGVTADAGNVFVRKINTESRLKYEINQKYYSSPYTAVMTIELTEAFGAAPSQAEAQQLIAAPENRLKRDVVRINYTTQNGIWTTTDADIVTEVKRRRDDPTWGPPLSIKLGRDVMLRSSEPWATCVR